MVTQKVKSMAAVQDSERLIISTDVKRKWYFNILTISHEWELVMMSIKWIEEVTNNWTHLKQCKKVMTQDKREDESNWIDLLEVEDNDSLE